MNFHDDLESTRMSTGYIDAAVPVLRVASVARSLTWYEECLGFSGDAVGPSHDPLFAILRRDGVELMLQKLRGGAAPSRAAGRSGGWDVYLRIDDVQSFRDALETKIPDLGPIEDREYGCRGGSVVADPDGHVIVLGECG